LNEHGVSYNDQDVFKFLILGFWSWYYKFFIYL
jgi:hypothetical protein